MANIQVNLAGPPPWNLTLVPPSTSPPPPLPTAFTNEGYPAGMELEGLTDWGRSRPFTDAFKTSRPWGTYKQSGGPGTPLNLNADGWPLSIPAGEGINTVMMHSQGTNYPTGRYVCLYDGDGGVNSDRFWIGLDGKKAGSQAPGRFEVDVIPTPTGLVGLNILSINPANPIRNIRFILPGYESTYNTTNVFDPAFLASLADFKVLRMMSWGWTNNSEVVSWADRRTLTGCRQSFAPGASIEMMVLLCNKLQADMWYCIPHKADNNYVTQAVTLIRNTLNSNLRLFLEYSNEVWNWGFGQARWAHDQGLLLWPGDTGAWMHYYGLRCAQVMDLAKAVFTSQPAGRLIRIMSSQAGYPTLGIGAMDRLVNGTGDFAYKHVDVFAIAPYFGHSIGYEANEAATQAMTVDQVLDAATAASVANYAPGGDIDQNFSNATTRGLKVIAYEGGQHLVGTGTAQNNVTIAALLIAANRHPRMRKIYADDLARWTARGGGMFSLFAHIGPYTKYGSWGLMEALDQNQATAYKLLGVRDWIASVT